MATAKTWQHLTVIAPADDAVRLLPREAGTGALTFVLGELDGHGRAHGARRFPARWTDGRAEGEAYVEVRPHSAHLSELVVHLTPPAGVARTTWTRLRLRREALALAVMLRSEIENRHEMGGGPTIARRNARVRTA